MHTLHLNLRAATHKEAVAASRFDAVDAKRAPLLRAGGVICAGLARRFEEADTAYDAAVEARIEIENAIMLAPIATRADVRAKVHILVSRTDTWGEADVSRLEAVLVDQIMAFAERHRGR
jgi:hypothetical protein